MGEIQPFRDDHLADVASLYLKVMRGRKNVTSVPRTLEAYFREIFLENPWTAPDIPSLVYCDNGAVVGFLGVVPRPMLFRNRPIRVAVPSQFMVDRERHCGPAAMELMHRFFEGPQDLAYNDGAGEDAHIVWTGLGGHAANSYSFNWLRPLRPMRTVRDFVGRAHGLVRLAGRVFTAAAAPMDYLIARAPHEALRKPSSPHASKPINTDELFECIQAIAWREPLKPAYELTSFRWLISQVASAQSTGWQLRTASVSGPDGKLSGWYVYQYRPGGPAQLLQIGSRRPDQFDAILLALFLDAWQCGASSVKGQAIPRYLVNLTNHYCLFRHATTSVLFHSRNKELLDAIYQGKAALSKLDGEGWMRFALEGWT